MVFLFIYCFFFLIIIKRKQIALQFWERMTKSTCDLATSGGTKSDSNLKHQMGVLFCFVLFCSDPEKRQSNSHSEIKLCGLTAAPRGRCSVGSGGRRRPPTGHRSPRTAQACAAHPTAPGTTEKSSALRVKGHTQLQPMSLPFRTFRAPKQKP